jgi:hypothetical protein
MEYPSYRYPVASLYTGSSLGNYYTFARLTADTDLQDLWSARDDQYYMGRWTIGFLIDGKKLEPRETIFRPESQETLFVSEDGSIEISKRFFIPYALDRSAQAQPSILQSCMFLIRATRAPAGRSKIVARHELHFPAGPAERFTKQPPTEQGSKQFEITERDSWFEIVTAGSGREARVLGSDAIPRNTTGTPASLLFEHELTANPGATAGMSFILAYSPEGAAAARDIYLRCTDTAALLAQSRTEYSNLLARSEILTPEPVINRGIGWAKVDSARVQHRYRTGEGFTNDPPQDIIVVRDLGWYVLGSDYFTPEFSHNLLELAERHAFHPDGKLTEFIHAGEEKPALHDYKLNINDDTPLYVYALHHHALLCGGPDAPERAYPLMKRACDYILSQEEDGLIRCHSSGTNVWGICGWRNIIEGYNLTGAVTEINVECRAALQH